MPKLERMDDMKPEQQESAVYKAYLANIRISETMMDEILLGIREGEPAESLLIKAAHAMSAMTNNNSFGTQIERFVKEVYGDGLRRPGALKVRISELESYIERLEKSAAEADEEDVRTAINLSVKACRERIDRLRKQDEA